MNERMIRRIKNKARRTWLRGIFYPLLTMLKQIGAREWRRMFRGSYNQALKTYSEYKDNNFDPFVVPVWKKNHRKIEQIFLEAFPYDFLTLKTIRDTMFISFAGGWQKTQVRTLEQVFKKTKLQKYLSEHPVGKPLITDLRYNTSHNRIHQLYHLARWQQESGMQLESVQSVIEWGSGYGCMADIFSRINPDITYTIIDLPVFTAIQEVYLRSVSKKDVHVLMNSEDTIKQGSINLVPLGKNMSLENIEKQDLFISTWALSESNSYSQQFVEKTDFFRAKHVLIAHQQKTEDFRAADSITNYIKKSTVFYHQPIPFLKNQSFYLFGERSLEE